ADAARRLARGAATAWQPPSVGPRTGRTPPLMASRADFPVLEDFAYLNAGTNGPLARQTVDAVVAEMELEGRSGRSGGPFFERVRDLRAQARRSFADLLGVEPDSIALADSTTRGCAIVLAGLELSAEDEI